MRPPLLPVKFHNFVPLVVVMLVMMLATFTGFLSSFDVLFYNLFSRMTPLSSGTDNQVLIVDVPLNRKSDADETWQTLLRKLQMAGARQVVFTFFPPKASTSFYQAAVASKRVVFGRNAWEHQDEPGRLIIEKYPEAAEGLPVVSGLMLVPKDELGTFRSQYRSVTSAGIRYQSLENAAIEQLGRKFRNGNFYYVNFLGRLGALPNVGLDRALSGGVIPELVKSKTVLVGFSGSEHQMGLHTPLSGKKELTPLEFHGYALDTLLSGKPVKVLPTWGVFLLAISLVLCGFLVQGILETRFFSWVTFTAIFLFLVLCWAVLAYAHLWIPPVDCLAAFGVTFLVSFRQRSILAERTIGSVLYTLTTRLKQRSMPESFQSSAEYWSQVITLVNQTLHLSRGIFLEKIPDDHRVREVKALNCSISDIKEMRRDYHREPYTSAINAGGVVRLVDRLFLSDAGIEDEEQYMAPLIFGGQTLGFWAFGIQSHHVAEIDGFESVITDFANQISELLFRREEWQKQQAEKTSLLTTVTDFSLGSTQDSLAKAVALMERRYGLLESVFQGLASATILYDLFGRVLHVNKSMVNLLSVVGVAPYRITALDLVVCLTGETMEQVRGHLRKVLLGHEEITFQVQHESIQTRHILKVRPLMDSSKQHVTEGITPFSAVGFLLEIVETSLAPSQAISEVPLERDKDDQTGVRL